MAKRKTPKQKPPTARAAKGRTPEPVSEFDRTVSALFQVPKSAVDEAEAKRPKRNRKKSDPNE
jgi:hypothetical protein